MYIHIHIHIYMCILNVYTYDLRRHQTCHLRKRNEKLGQAWVLGPEDRRNIETQIPSHVEIESIELRPTLYVCYVAVFVLRFVLQFLKLFRRHQTCHFCEHATSAAA